MAKKKVDIEALRHSAAHVLAQAVKELWPDVKITIGPVIENGFYYDFDKDEPFTPADLKKIEKKMKSIVHRKLDIKKVKLSDKEVKELLEKEPYKKELIDEIKERGEEPTFYRQGDFVDLCRGPHVKNTSEVKAFKLLKVAGAYWKGDSNNKQLQRIYGTAWASKEELKDYLTMLEEADKRNHVKIGKQLGLFSFHEEGPGFPFFHPKGIVVWNELMNFWREEHEKAGYVEIKTPILLSRTLWEKSGHWDNYRENMYITNIDKEVFAIKPMNCPGGMLYYNERLHSYRELPLRIAEIGLVHRHELSGVLNGLFRVRAFHQDDSHIFMTEDQIKDEILNILNIVDRMYKVFGFDYHLELSTRPEKFIGTKEAWEKATKSLKAGLKASGKKFQINEGDGAFYGPKIDVHIKDALGRTWQCATIQLDMNLPKRFELTYEGKDGHKHEPIVIHRVIYGGIERFFGLLIEHYAGKFPLWLAPVQVVLLTVTDRNNKFAEKVYKKMKEAGIRVELDQRSESISKKVRDSQVMNIPKIVTIGDKEVKKKTLAVRSLNGKVDFGVKVDSFIKDLVKEIKKRK